MKTKLATVIASIGMAALALADLIVAVVSYDPNAPGGLLRLARAFDRARPTSQVFRSLLLL